jgi:beta-glucuronidase
MTKPGADDPFAHLHDEDYARTFETGFVGARDLVNIGNRDIVSLDGDWRMTLDPFDECLRQKWYALDETPSSQWATPRDYEIEAGESVPVPSCWNVLKPEWTYFEGAALYTRHFAWRRGTGGERGILHFGAANHAALVFVNGRFVGGHRGGSTPFSMDVTDCLRDGNNRLQVHIENHRRADRVPMHHFDWFNYGGLYREVSLLRLPAAHIRRATAALLSDRRSVRFTVALSEKVSASARVSIPELGFTGTMPVAEGSGELVVELPVEFWSPERPRLYDVQFEFGEDGYRDRIGFRTIETRGTDIFLNGEPIWLRGVCVHEDDRELGKTSSPADMRRRFQHAKELGCNFLRLTHYPHHEQVARIADELGFLLWAEIPVYWAIDFANPATYADAENQLAELIGRDANRASIIIWGVGNENADTDARLAFMRGLAAHAKHLDSTRLVSAACLINRETFAIADRLADSLDVIGLNEYFGWYEPNFSGLDRLLANSKPDRPVIVSETGADATPGYRGAGRVLFTEDWQAEFHRQQIARLAACPSIRGIALWLLYDFRSERRQTGFQRGFNRKGLIAEDKERKKLAFAAVAEIFRLLARRAK